MVIVYCDDPPQTPLIKCGRSPLTPLIKGGKNDDVETFHGTSLHQ